jgi:hypothetical protein
MGETVPTYKFLRTLYPNLALFVVLLLVTSMVPVIGQSTTTSPARSVVDSRTLAPASEPIRCGGLHGTGQSPSQSISFNMSQCNFMSNISFDQYTLTYGPPSQNGSQVVTSRSLEYSYNFSMDIGGIAEIDHSGQIVQFANLSHTVGVGGSGIIGNSSGTTYFFNNSGPVTNASGAWTSSTFSSGGVSQSGSILGNVDVMLAFFFPSSGLNTGALKFSVDVSQWPWASPADHLGIELGAFAQAGAHFSWNSTTQNLSEWTGNGSSPTIGLQLGPSASTSGPGVGPSSVVISASAALFTGGADLLLNFTGGGGYTYLHYDPWVIFNVGTGTLAPSGGASVLDLSVVLAIAVGCAVGVLLGVGLFRARRTKPDPSL